VLTRANGIFAAVRPSARRPLKLYGCAAERPSARGVSGARCRVLPSCGYCFSESKSWPDTSGDWRAKAVVADHGGKASSGLRSSRVVIHRLTVLGQFSSIAPDLANLARHAKSGERTRNQSCTRAESINCTAGVSRGSARGRSLLGTK
jgi:hypothetical protein